MDAAYFREKAMQVRHFADITMNREVREALDRLAIEFEERAAALRRARKKPFAVERD